MTDYDDHLARAEAWLRPVNKPTDSAFRKFINYFRQKHSINDPVTIELLLGCVELFAFSLSIVGIWLISVYPPTVMIGISVWTVATTIYAMFWIWHRRYLRRLRRGY